MIADGFSLEFEWQQVSLSLQYYYYYYYHYYYFTPWDFFTYIEFWVIATLLRTLLSILAVHNNVVVWMVFTRPLFSTFSSSFNNPLVTGLKAPITIIIIVTFMFHSYFSQFPNKVQVLILLFTFFHYYFVVSWDSKVDNFAISLLL